MNGLPTNGVWGYAPAVGRQVAVGVWGYAGLGTRQPAAVTEGMKQFNQILRPKRAPGGEIFARSASRLTIFPVSNPPPLSRLRPGPPPLSALSVRRRDHPPWSRYLESIFFHDMGRPAVALQSEREKRQLRPLHASMVSEGYGGMLWPPCGGTHAGYEGMPLSRFGRPFIPYPPFDRNPARRSVLCVPGPAGRAFRGRFGIRNTKKP
jgi:hypothetical protein